MAGLYQAFVKKISYLYKKENMRLYNKDGYVFFEHNKGDVSDVVVASKSMCDASILGDIYNENSILIDKWIVITTDIAHYISQHLINAAIDFIENDKKFVKVRTEMPGKIYNVVSWFDSVNIIAHKDIEYGTEVYNDVFTFWFRKKINIGSVEWKPLSDVPDRDADVVVMYPDGFVSDDVRYFKEMNKYINAGVRESREFVKYAEIVR